MGQSYAFPQLEDFPGDFVDGLKRFARGDYDGALRYFRTAVAIAPEQDLRRDLYLSYQGVAMVYVGDWKGVELCRRAATEECLEGDVFYNLALAELRTSGRSAAIAALEIGLEVAPRHEKLRRLDQKLGRRRRAVFPFLRRDHFMNRCVGRLLYRRAAAFSR